MKPLDNVILVLKGAPIGNDNASKNHQWTAHTVKGTTFKKKEFSVEGKRLGAWAVHPKVAEDTGLPIKGYSLSALGKEYHASPIKHGAEGELKDLAERLHESDLSARGEQSGDRGARRKTVMADWEKSKISNEWMILPLYGFRHR